MAKFAKVRISFFSAFLSFFLTQIVWAAEAAHHAEEHAEEGASMELPNVISLLHHYFPHQSFVNFLHQWENIFFSLLVAFLIAWAGWIASKRSALIPQGSVSIEVYADVETKAEAMLTQAREFYKWITNAHIKFPTTTEGLKAAEAAVKEGMKVNMTLVFSQEQAAAVYAATKGAKKGDVFLSPFIGRLDDRGERGMDLIANIIKMYQSSDGHVEVLTASVRSIEHFLEAIRLGSDIITAPFKILKDWAESGLKMPDENFNYQTNLKPIPYQQIDFTKPWQEYNIHHDLTDKGIAKFSEDWNSLIVV